ncbi:MAG: trypsin-like peptidase domain-containing protein [Paludibacteraceae bacterium]
MKKLSLLQKNTLCIWMVLIGTLFLNISLKAQDVSYLIPQIKDAVFTVYAEDENKETFASGSGFFISETGVGITNFHVLQGANYGHIKCTNGKEFQISRIIDYNPQYDLIKFQVGNTAQEKITFLKLQSKIPLQGEAIINYSNPLGHFENTVSSGIVSAVRDYNGYEKVLQITAPISHGSSGSPVMNTKGEVVGVATFGFEGGQNLNFAVSVQQIQKLNRNLSIKVSDMQANPFETANVKRGQSLAIHGNYDDAFALFDKEIEANPKNHLAYYYRGLWRSRVINDLAGMEDLLQACTMDTSNYEYYVKAAGFVKNTIIKMTDAKYEIPEEISSLAANLYMRCISIDPYRADAYAGFGYVFLYLGKSWNYPVLFDDGIGYLNKAIELSPDPSFFMYRAELYDKKGEFGKAILDCTNALTIDNNFWRAYQIRGTIRAYELYQYNEGILDLVIAADLAPTDIYKADINAMLGTIYYRKFMFSAEQNSMDLSEGLKYAQKAYALNPTASNKALIADIQQLKAIIK